MGSATFSYLTLRVRQQAGSYRFCARRRLPVLYRITGLTYAEKVAGVARINLFCVRRSCPVLYRIDRFRVRRRSPVLRESTVGARLPANAVSLTHGRCLTHRVRQQAGSYMSCVRRRLQVLPRIDRFCVRRRLPVLRGSTDFAYAEGCPVLHRINRFRVRRRSPVLRESTVGARLPANAVSLTHGRCLTHRVRQQAGPTGRWSR